MIQHKVDWILQSTDSNASWFKLTASETCTYLHNIFILIPEMKLWKPWEMPIQLRQLQELPTYTVKNTGIAIFTYLIIKQNSEIILRCVLHYHFIFTSWRASAKISAKQFTVEMKRSVLRINKNESQTDRQKKREKKLQKLNYSE